ncbi:pseudouridine synthase pus4 [Neophaeococcomyces mojaviensis]|uniref:Pseudouridine synthase pus4 n=1 Tax=Neophaeococcomyces mojaviensis TaxID=3383035 RepID=A0ACC3AJF7_9EURO|nr:pseudouridine synthase pus4 [Knufia sp. JES_112]
MAESTGKVLEGVFAIKKPASLSSAQVLRDLQQAFKDSRTFASLRAQENRNRDNHRSKRRRIDKDNVFKMGHGGTLDPMATGVLIVGIGRGTKHLQGFLDCTKVYRTVVLFGKSTDTYDIAGKVVASAETGQINQQLVRQKIDDQFRGNIQQVPPIYSALKINGMKAYEYARSGKELPKELAARSVTISEIKLEKWYDSGAHNYRWPAEEAPQEEKALFQKLIKSADDTEDAGSKAVIPPKSISLDDEGSFAPVSEAPELSRSPKSPVRVNTLSKDETAALHTHAISGLSEEPADAPAARVELTVSSGFYVRSFAHDLGLACSSYGTMAELARTRQGDYTTEEAASEDLISAIDYAEIRQSEEVWGPKITKVLENWMEKNLAPKAIEDQRQSFDRRNYQSNQGHKTRGQGGYRREKSPDNDFRKRRNSSSPER